MAHRYFTTDITADTARVTGPDAVHLVRVLRVKPGDALVLCDGAGTDYEAEVVQVSLENVALRVLSSQPSKAEPSIAVTLYLGYAKGERMDWAIQKAVELGAVRIVPFYSENSMVKPKNEKEKVARYNRVALEAAKQSGRGAIPSVGMPMQFEEMTQMAAQNDVALFFYEEGGKALRKVLGQENNVAIITGPEGGFAPKEARQAIAAGCVPIGLGPRILRSETAPAVAIAAVMLLSGNLE